MNRGGSWTARRKDRELDTALEGEEGAGQGGSRRCEQEREVVVTVQLLHSSQGGSHPTEQEREGATAVQLQHTIQGGSRRC